MKKAGRDIDTGNLMFFPEDTTAYPQFEISSVLVTKQQEIDYLKKQIAGKKFKIENNAIVEIIKTQAEIDACNLAQGKQNAIATLKLNYINAQKAIIQTNEGQFNIDLRGEEWKTDIHKQWTDANILGSAKMLNKITGVATSLTKDYWNNFYSTYNEISVGNLQKLIQTTKQIENATSLTALNSINLKPYPAVPVFDIAGSVPGGSYTVTPPTNGNSGGSLGGDSTLTNGVE